MKEKLDGSKSDLIIIDLLTQILVRVNSMEDALYKHLKEDHGKDELWLINRRRAFENQHWADLREQMISRHQDIRDLLLEVFGQMPPDPSEGSNPHS